MEKDFRGYSARIVQANKAADATHPGVMLGRLCIAKEIPVSHVAEFFGVTRMTVYKWFKGTENPRKQHVGMIEETIASLKKTATLD